MPTPLQSASVVLMLAAVPFIAWIERVEPTVWTTRLLLPFFESEPSRHTPLHAIGTFLPPIINADTLLTPADNPVILTTTTRVLPGTTLTLTAGTTIVAHEFAQLIIDGTLHIKGKPTAPVTLTTNEAHESNRTWGGILFNAQSTGMIQYATIHYGSPGISCLQESKVSITNTTITTGSAGIFVASNQCSVRNSTILSVQEGIIGIHLEPQISDTRISAQRTEVAVHGATEITNKELNK